MYRGSVHVRGRAYTLYTYLPVTIQYPKIIRIAAKKFSKKRNEYIKTKLSLTQKLKSKLF